MNRAVLTNVEGLTEAMLPPPRGGAAAPRDSEPLRVLFLNAHDLGFKTTSRMFEQYTAGRGDVDAVHINMRTPRLVRYAGASGYLQSWRMAQAWAGVMGRWFRGPLRLDRFDVVLVMTQQRALGLARARKRWGDRVPPYVVNIDATCLGWCDTFGNRKPVLDLDAAMERKVYSHAGGIGCYSHWAAESVLRDYGVGPDKAFVYVPCVPVPHMGESGRVKAARLAERASGGGGSGKGMLRLVFVGNDWDRKGGPRVLKWHQERWKDKAELHVCSGKAPRDESAVNVVWHGSTPNDKLMKEVLPSMDVFVMPTYVDATPIAIQEAASCGLPVVSTRIAGIPELVEDGVTGFLCDRSDDAAYIAAVERLIADPGLVARMSEAASRRVQRELSADRWLSHLFDNLRAVAAGRGVRMEPEGISLRPGAVQAAAARAGAR